MPTFAGIFVSILSQGVPQMIVTLQEDGTAGPDVILRDQFDNSPSQHVQVRWNTSFLLFFCLLHLCRKHLSTIIWESFGCLSRSLHSTVMNNMFPLKILWRACKARGKSQSLSLLTQSVWENNLFLDIIKLYVHLEGTDILLDFWTISRRLHILRGKPVSRIQYCWSYLIAKSWKRCILKHGCFFKRQICIPCRYYTDQLMRCQTKLLFILEKKPSCEMISLWSHNLCEMQPVLMNLTCLHLIFTFNKDTTLRVKPIYTHPFCISRVARNIHYLAGLVWLALYILSWSLATTEEFKDILVQFMSSVLQKSQKLIKKLSRYSALGFIAVSVQDWQCIWHAYTASIAKHCNASLWSIIFFGNNMFFCEVVKHYRKFSISEWLSGSRKFILLGKILRFRNNAVHKRHLVLGDPNLSAWQNQAHKNSLMRFSCVTVHSVNAPSWRYMLCKICFV